MRLLIKTPADLQAEHERAERVAARNAARDYLAATDWMVVRQAETGAPVPEEVLQRRRGARARCEQ